MQQHSLASYSRWHLWHDDMSLQRKSLHSLEHLLKVPELRSRAVLGPSIEASCIAHTFTQTTNARALSRTLRVSYAAIERLVGRGLLLRTRNGVAQDLRLSSLCADVLHAQMAFAIHAHARRAPTLGQFQACAFTLPSVSDLP